MALVDSSSPTRLRSSSFLLDEGSDSSSNKRDNEISLPSNKKQRSGSISGRLRAASDLADMGMLNSSEKALVKDLIIVDDADVNAAIDKYHADGDTTTLADIVKKPEKRRQSIGKLYIILYIIFLFYYLFW